MKTPLLLLGLGLLLTTPGQAQSPAAWAPGARWTYLASSWGFRGDLRLQYVGDTTIAGRSCQKLTREVDLGTGSIYRPRPLFTAADGDAVWVYADTQFYKMYDFGARPGDSWATLGSVGGRSWCPVPVQVTVDSVGQQVVGGRLRRWFRASYTATYPGSATQTYSWGRVYEGIGPLNGFMTLASTNPQCILSDPPGAGALLCYGTSSGTVYLNSQYPNCSAKPVATAVAPPAKRPALRVAPNPSSGLLELTLPAAYQSGTVAVHDLAGRRVWQAPAASPRADLRPLPRGWYIVSVQAPGQPPLTQRVVLQ